MAGLAAPSHRPGVERPAFAGPLVAFDSGPDSCAGDSVRLGGDLHAVHSATRVPGPPPDRDGSLDPATVTLFDGEGWSLDVPATDGVWCTLPGDLAPDCAPYFALIDGRGRLRAWLILPSARTMIGIAHFWLPQVDPPLGSSVGPDRA
jgi:hypothetical protein